MIALAALALSGALSLAQIETDPSASHWNQAQGNSYSSSSVAVAPMEAVPAEFWRLDDLGMASEPVVWGGTIYVVSEDGGRQTLVALDAQTGEKQASVTLGRMDDANYRLAVWQDMVVAFNKEEVRGFTHKTTVLRKRWATDLLTAADPCMAEGVLFVNSQDLQIHALDSAKGTLFGSAPGGWGKPVATGGTLVTILAGDLENYNGGVVVHANHTARPQAKSLKRKGDWAPLFEVAVFGPLVGGVPDNIHGLGLTSTESTSTDRGYLDMFYLNIAKSAYLVTGGLSRTFDTSILGRSTATESEFFGFGKEGLIKQDFEGSSWVLLPTADLPPGAKPGHLARAGNVLYAGNMGFDIERGRVLWVLEGIDFTGPIIPLGDERGLIVTTDGALVAVGSGKGNAGGGGPLEAEVAALRPDAGPGLVLATGEVKLGAVTESGDFTVTPEDGEPATFTKAEVAVILPPTAGAKARLVGDEFALVMAWEALLGDANRDRLVNIFDDYRKAKLVTDCNRVLELIERLHPAAKQDLIASLGGVRQSAASNAGMKRDRVGEDELEAFGKDVEARSEAAAWCHGVGLDGAATLLIQSAEKASEEGRAFWKSFGFQGARPPAEPAPFEAPEAVQLAKLLPAHFPFQGSDLGALWGQWAVELLPASARFTLPGEPGVPKQVTAPWTEDTLILRTDNMVLLSRCHDPVIMGPILRYAEGALRLLDEIFGMQSPLDSPLEVRLHRNREDYIAESEISRSIGQWTLGYYSPSEHISRFFVPSAEGTSASAVEQKLQEVVVHELTHQYISERAGYSEVLDPRIPGHWIVEGFARFIEQQAVELGRNGRGLADHTVLSIDLCSRLLEQDALLPMEGFLNTTNLSFQELAKEGGIPVKPRYAVGTYTVSETSLYYSQAGALCFFLMNRCGEDGPKRLLTYLEARYEARLPKDHVTLLGFDSVAELDAAFRTFLASPGPR
jgi:hypothetical protein